ncbi:MAG: AAA family ATPase [Thermomicrobium sp.]|nr:AAA family ATPase [Thermomicrobium sp.]MDW8060288.1 AAA family ATPase [Thermomicrobium sp.]
MRVVLVGPCGAGKSTIARELAHRGIDAVVVGQEHSIVRDLWRRPDPDLVVFLDASLETVRARRGADWPEWLYRTEQERLAEARAHADLVLDTGRFSVEEVVQRIVAALERGGAREDGGSS